MRSIITHIRQSLALKLSIGILLMAVPVFLVSLGILFVQSRSNVKREAMEHANAVLSTTMQRVNRFMNNVETATNVNDWEVTANLYPDSILAYSRFIVTLNGNIDGCSISTEPDILPQYSQQFSAYTVREHDTITTVIEKEYDYFDKIWYKKPKTLGEPCWVVFYDESDSLEVTLDGMIASYCKPLYDDNKRFIGVISTDLALKHLSKVIAAEKPYPDSYFVMIGDEGRYYVHPDTTKLFNKTIFSDFNAKSHTDLIALGYEMTTGKQGNLNVKINGESCLVCYQPVPGTNWSLALICPDRNILQSYNRLTYIIAGLIIVGLLLILFFSFTTVAQTIRPLNELTEKVKRITLGHYDEQISRSHYQDAVGRLQNSFATMQESLNKHINDIQQMNVEAAQRNEELVKASKLAEEGNRQKEIFIQNVSHQIRTPLNIITGFAQVLHDSKNMLPEDELKNVTDTMFFNAQVLDRMNRMLIDSSVWGSTKELYANRNDRVFCNEVAQYAIGKNHELFPQLQITFETSLLDNFYIHTNRTYLTVTIQELLFNAAKYSDGQHISLYLSKTERTVCFIVEDTGPGFPAEDSERLFDLFAKVNDLSDGLGLGLSLSKRHITSLNGTLNIDTSYHDGCRIVIELPIT